ncbi:MAG: hypothetical protein QOJ54_103 [Aliidongia sp.]|nr:hypothetical protein [Aliidongia sp.]
MHEEADIHSADCDCFGCAIRLHAQRCIDGGILEGWAVPSDLIQMLAEHLTTHVSPANHLLAVERYSRDLRTAVVVLRPELGATIIHINDRGQTDHRADDMETHSGTAGGALSPGRHPPDHSQHSKDSGLAMLAITNVALLPRQNRFGGDHQPRRGRRTSDTMTIAALADLTAEILVNMTTEGLHQLWWSCQAWCDITTPRSLKAKSTHTGFASHAYANQQRIASELASRGAPIPMAPSAEYITAIRTDQA